MDAGPPISYMLLAEGTPVVTADGERFGAVKRVLAVENKDVFDGLILDTEDGERFVDADHVGELYERAVHLTLTREEARHLPEPSANPAAMRVDPDDTVDRSPGEQIGDAVRKAWDRVSGNY